MGEALKLLWLFQHDHCDQYQRLVLFVGDCMRRAAGANVTVALTERLFFTVVAQYALALQYIVHLRFSLVLVSANAAALAPYLTKKVTTLNL